ncbi:MAG: beta-ketoacyl-ACP synthase II [Deltaproteobacteria bacterium]|nr:beta-ketoacyl-ACP synthase II [Deltaproteobacteria bacterium]
MKKRRVVITGLGVLSPLGNTTQETWANAKAGKSGIGPITRFDTSAFSSRIAGEVKGFDAAKYFEPKEVKKHDIFTHYAMGASHEAWQDAGLSDVAYERSRMGCVLGVGMGGLGYLERCHEIFIKGGPRKISPFLIPALISNLAPGNVAIRFGLRGPNYAITSACASSAHAIGEACRLIADGLQDLMLTGGAESTVTQMGIGGFCALRALSTRNDEPTKASRPWDRDRDGFVMSEGAAILILEEFEAARKRGAKIYAELTGYGASCDAEHITAPAVDGSGARQCMQSALDYAGLKSTDITYVNAHGTSTEAGDLAETLAIKEVFGGYAKDGLMVDSTKSMTGHLLGAAGAIEAVFATLSIIDGIIPPTINLDNPSEGCDLDYVPHKARPCKVRHVMSNSFGFGGTNAALIVSALS